MPDERAALLRELIVAVVLVVAGVMVTIGAAMFAAAAGWIVAGVALAAWAVRVL